jgi:hypothetical protein
MLQFLYSFHLNYTKKKKKKKNTKKGFLVLSIPLDNHHENERHIFVTYKRSINFYFSFPLFFPPFYQTKNKQKELGSFYSFFCRVYFFLYASLHFILTA